MIAPVRPQGLPNDPKLLVEKQAWTVDDLAGLRESLRYELINGWLALPSFADFHEDLCQELESILRPHCPSGYEPVTALPLVIGDRTELRPDVVVMREADTSRIPAPAAGALLVVEVVPPNWHFHHLNEKLAAYAGSRIGTCLLVDPTPKRVELMEFRIDDGGQYDIAVCTSKIFETQIPYPIKIDVSALTALRDKPRDTQADR